MTVAGRDGWLFLRSELEYLTKDTFWGEAATSTGVATAADRRDPLPAILDFAGGLADRDIHLLVVPVPSKARIYPDGLPGKPQLPRPAETGQEEPSAEQRFYKLLRAQGVDVLDLTPVFLKERSGDQPLYCRQDSHWSGRGLALAARTIAEHLHSRGVLSAETPAPFTSATEEVTIRGDLWQGLAEPDRPGPETLVLERVRPESTTADTVSENSPVLLLGDSHTLVFHSGGDMHARSAGLVDRLALQLGQPLDLLGVRGSGATAARIDLHRKGRGNPDWLANKRVIVWCFTARDFTQTAAGWRVVPLP
jgi:alginate O-acetyltransferase complex protein AlgJ